MKITFAVLLIVLVCALMGASGQIFFKLASKKFSFSVAGLLTNYYFIIGASLYALSAMLFVWSLKHGDLSLLYPIIATSYIWVTLFSSVVLGEPIPPLRWFGVALIIVGIVVIVR